MAYAFATASNQSLICSTAPVFDLQNNNFTISFSFSCLNVSLGIAFTQTLLSIISGSGGLTNGFAIYIEQGVLSFNPYIDSGSQSFQISRSVASNTQYAVAVIRSGTSFTLYTNNTQSTTATSSLTFGTGRPLTIANWNGINRPFGGTMSDVAIWNAALTTPEIASLAAGFTPEQIRPQSLQFYAPLVRNLIDVRGGRAITNVNGATVATHPRIIS